MVRKGGAGQLCGVQTEEIAPEIFHLPSIKEHSTKHKKWCDNVTEHNIEPKSLCLPN